MSYLSKFFPDIDAKKSNNIPNTSNGSPAPQVSNGNTNGLMNAFPDLFHSNSATSSVIESVSSVAATAGSGSVASFVTGDEVSEFGTNEVLEQDVGIGSLITPPMTVYNPIEMKQTSKSLAVEKITKYKSSRRDASLINGDLVSVTDMYISYAVKNGLIRVINRQTVNNFLLRGQTKDITDIQVFASSMNRIASSSMDGTVYIRDIIEMESGEIGTNDLLVIRHDADGEYFKKIKWHPSDPNIVLLISGAYIVEVSINQASSTVSDGILLSLPSLPSIVASPMNGIKVLVTCPDNLASNITDVEYSLDNGSHFLASSDDGKVYVWDASHYRVAHSFIPHGGKSITSVHFVSSGTTSAPLLLTGAVGNKEIKLHSPPGPDGVSKCMHTLTITTGNVFVSTLKGNHVILADTTSPRLIIVEVGSSGFTSVSQFDDLLSPIISMCVEVDSEDYSNLNLFCVQTLAIQRYTIPIVICCAPPAITTTTAGSFIGNSDSLFEADSVTTENNNNMNMNSIASPICVETSITTTTSTDDEGEDIVEDSSNPEVIISPASSVPSATTTPVTATDATNVKLPVNPILMQLLQQVGSVVATTTSAVTSAATTTSTSVGAPNISLLNPSNLTESQPRSTDLVHNDGILLEEEVIVPSSTCTPPGIVVAESSMDVSDERTAATTSATTTPSTSITEGGTNKASISEGALAHTTAATASAVTIDATTAATTSAASAAATTSAASAAATDVDRSSKDRALLIALAKQQQAIMVQIDKRIAKRIDSTINTKFDELYLKLKDDADEREQANTKSLQGLIHAISSSINTKLPDVIEGIVESKFEEYMPQLNGGVGLNQSELLEEIVNSDLVPQIKEQVSRDLVDKLQEPIQAAFASTIVQIVPKLEIVLGHMFTQIDNSFKKNVRDKITSSLTSLTALESEITNIMKESLNVAKQINDSSNSLQTVGLQRHPSLINIVPKFDFKGLLSSGKGDEAFTHALGANDTNIVVRVCTEAEEMVITLQSLHLSQPVILCVIQQLSSDISSRSDIKLRWIKDCALALNPADPTISSHCKSILKGAQELLAEHSAIFSNTELFNEYRLTMHLINSLSTF